MNVTIEVTADDIAKGKPCEAVECQVFLAASRALPEVRLAVGPETLWIGESFCDRAGWDAPLPDVAVGAIHRIDNGQPVEPFSFVVDIPDTLIPAGAS